MHFDDQNQCLKPYPWLFHDFCHFLTNSMTIPGLENKNHFPWLFQAEEILQVSPGKMSVILFMPRTQFSARPTKPHFNSKMAAAWIESIMQIHHNCTIVSILNKRASCQSDRWFQFSEVPQTSVGWIMWLGLVGWELAEIEKRLCICTYFYDVV